ncbi:glycosyltransferase [Pelagibacteraceae bacterium]|nr:glycosyltransferase [Pelagibacteraceae bacterium]
MESKELTIVIVTFKSEEKILNCLKSIPSNTPVIVVENSNNNNFKRKIENSYKNIDCVLTGSNTGYSVANNIGLKLVKTKYALVLNPDTVIEKDAIENFLYTVKTIDDFWLMGPANDQAEKLDFKEKTLKEVKNLKGFALFFNLKKFKKNYFDENFFLFFEEIDLCKRVISNSGKIYLNKKIIIKHEGASSVSKDNLIELEKNRNWHWMWSTFYFHKKYRGYFTAVLIIFPKLLPAFFKFLFYLFILNKKKRDIYFCRLNGILNSMLGKKSWYRPAID